MASMFSLLSFTDVMIRDTMSVYLFNLIGGKYYWQIDSDLLKINIQIQRLFF